MTSGPRHRERGLATSTAWAVLVPLLLTLILGLIQTGAWLHARMATTTAASTASQQLAALNPSEPAARDAATRIAAQAGLTDIEFTATRTTTEVTVTITGTALSLIPGTVRISAQATHPLERVTRP